jgi:hypothetical protein
MTATLTTPFPGRVDLQAISDRDLFIEKLFNSDKNLVAFTGAGPVPTYGDRTDAYALDIDAEIRRRAFGPALARAKSSPRYLTVTDAEDAANHTVKEMLQLSRAKKLAEDCLTTSIEAIAMKRVVQRDHVVMVDRGTLITATGMKKAPHPYERQVSVLDPTGATYEEALPISGGTPEDIDAAVDAEVAAKALERASAVFKAAEERFALASKVVREAIEDEAQKVAELGSGESLADDVERLDAARASHRLASSEALRCVANLSAARKALRRAELAAKAAETPEATVVRGFHKDVEGVLNPKQANALLHSTLITRESNDYLDRLAEADRASRGPFVETETIDSLRALVASEEKRVTPLRKAAQAAEGEAEDARELFGKLATAADERRTEMKKWSDEKKKGVANDEVNSFMDRARLMRNSALNAATKASETFDRETSDLRSLSARLTLAELLVAKSTAETAVAEARVTAETTKALATDVRKRASAANPLVYRDRTDEEAEAAKAERAAEGNLARATEVLRALTVRIETSRNAIEKERRFASKTTAAITRISGNVEYDSGTDRSHKSRGGNVRTLGKEHIGKVMGVERNTAAKYVAAGKTALYTDFETVGRIRSGSAGVREVELNEDTLAYCLYLVAVENADSVGGILLPEHIDGIPSDWFAERAAKYGVPLEDITPGFIDRLRGALSSRVEADLDSDEVAA